MFEAYKTYAAKRLIQVSKMTEDASNSTGRKSFVKP
jgi:hypothetical protein